MHADRARIIRRRCRDQGDGGSHVYFDPNIGLVLQNYLEHRDQYEGAGNFDEDGLAVMQSVIPKGVEVFRKALAAGVRMPLGTDAVAGAHGHNARIIDRARAEGWPEADGCHRQHDLAGGRIAEALAIASARSGPATRLTSSRCR